MYETSERMPIRIIKYVKIKKQFSLENLHIQCLLSTAHKFVYFVQCISRVRSKSNSRRKVQIIVAKLRATLQKKSNLCESKKPLQKTTLI